MERSATTKKPDDKTGGGSDRAELERLSRLAALVDSSDDAIIGQDLNSNITSWNRGAAQLYGYTPEEIIGQSIKVLVRPDRVNEIDEIFTKIRDKKRVHQFDATRIKKDGNLISVSLTVSPIINDDGSVIGASSIARDITERKRAEEQAGTASQYARSLIEASLDPLVTISPEGKITDVNEGSIKVTGVSRENLIGTDFSDYFTAPDKAREGYQQVFSKGFVTDYPLTIRHKDGRLIDVLYNASVYKDSRGNVLGVFAAARAPDQAQVVVRARPVDAIFFRIEVEDTCIGISPDDIKLLFSEFRQLDSSASKKYQGTGLGLALTRRLVEAQGGQVGRPATSEKEVPSSRFYLGHRRPNVMTTILILIVDDNEAKLKVARVALQGEGFEVRVASDGEQALEMLKTFQPRLILMDIQLPGLDGLEVTRRLKADPKTCDIIVVAVTAYAMKGDRDKALQAGCDGYITKPLDPILLPGKVSDYLGELPGETSTDASILSGSESRQATTAIIDSLGTILLVEDNPITRKLFRIALETEGFSVIEADNGETALKIVSDTVPDLILQDLVLPDVDGLTLAPQLRKIIPDETPIICLSGFLARMEQARTAGCFADLLIKPVDPLHLVEVVKGHLLSQSSRKQRDGGGRRLLLVDDDPMLRKLTSLWLSQAGFMVEAFETGPEALAAARLKPPDAIVEDDPSDQVSIKRALNSAGYSVDLASSEAEAIEKYRRGSYAADPRTQNVTIVAVTAYAMRGDEERALAAGCDGYITKPIDTRTFPGAISDYFAAHLAKTL